MRLYRYENKTGFCKGISQAPVKLAAGMGNVEKVRNEWAGPRGRGPRGEGGGQARGGDYSPKLHHRMQTVLLGQGCCRAPVAGSCNLYSHHSLSLTSILSPSPPGTHTHTHMHMHVHKHTQHTHTQPATAQHYRLAPRGR